jgi:phosphoglycerate kinase
MIVDIGPQTFARYAAELQRCKTAVWNGPLGAFEISPFDCGTVSMCRLLAGLTRAGGLKTVAGGGDTVSAVTHAGLADEFTYLSTAGGAFLEWLEGKELPGLTALMKHAAPHALRA